MQNISIILPTYNRLALLTKCTDQLFNTPLDKNDEVIFWNNGSTDGTREFLNKIYNCYNKICKVIIVHNKDNVGLSAVNRGFKMMSNFYRMKIDDDIIKIPFFFKEKLLEVFDKIPDAGYIAAALENDDKLPQTFFKEYENPEIYQRIEANGIKLRLGNASGGFVMTTRFVFEKVGGFVEMPKEYSWFNEDSDYSHKVRGIGYLSGFREDLEVYHAFGPVWNKPYEKDYINKFCMWLFQPGIRNRDNAEKKQMLMSLSVTDDMADKIINKFEENNNETLR